MQCRSKVFFWRASEDPLCTNGQCLFFVGWWINSEAKRRIIGHAPTLDVPTAVVAYCLPGKGDRIILGQPQNQPHYRATS
jgi:hypothetical protein